MIPHIPPHAIHKFPLTFNDVLQSGKMLFFWPMSDMNTTSHIAVNRPFSYDINLPIHEKRREIVSSIRENPVTIVAGETGSGKTTQLPLMCLEAGRGREGRIACTQPRRIAAVSLAHHVAEAFGTEVGTDVGYRVRFTDSVAASTRIKFVTDGMLLAELGGDKHLNEYDTVIIDEAHERSVNIDFLLGCFRALLSKRSNLRLIISSATIDTKLFSRAFNHAPVFHASGRMFPIEIRYQPIIELWQGNRLDGYLEGALLAIRDIMEKDDSGDMLVFLPTTDDINELAARVRPLAAEKGRDVFPLHSRLPISEQNRIFEISDRQKIVISTNIAETSLTVPNVKYVIDTGLARVSRYDPSGGITRMPIQAISRASAEQRAGRCGRVRNGVCIRLYSEQDYNNRPSFSIPEIRRSNLSGVLLQMAYLGLGKASSFPFLQRPNLKAVNEGIRALRQLGAFTSKAQLTNLGRKMARMPLDPPVARMLLYAKKFGVVEQVITIASALSIDDPRIRSDTAAGSNSSCSHPDSDFMSFLKLWEAYRKNCRTHNPTALKSFCTRFNLSPQRMREWQYTHKQISRICKTLLSCGKQNPQERNQKALYEAIHKSLLSGLIGNCALRQENGLYRGLQEHDIMIHPSSTLFRKKPRWILFHQMLETKRIYGRTAAVIKPQWIEAVFARRCVHHYQDPWFDEESGTVRAHEEVTFGSFILVHNRSIDLKEKDMLMAREIFIREALVNEKLGDRFRFITHNRTVIDEVLKAQRKLRIDSLYAGDLALEQFYSDRLPREVYSRKDLLRCIRQRHDDSFLFLSQADIVTHPIPPELSLYPDRIKIASVHLPVEYLYDKGSIEDGAQIRVPWSLYKSVPSWYWEWLLPVYKKKRISHFMSIIADDLTRKGIDIPIAQKQLEDALYSADGPFTDSLRRAAGQILGIDLHTKDLPAVLFPPDMWPRITVIDNTNNVLDSYRPPFQRPQLPTHECAKRDILWEPHCRQWERADIDTWDFDSIVDKVAVSSPSQNQAISGIPSLCIEAGSVSLRIFWSQAHAGAAHAAAVKLLLENSLAEELAWAEAELQLPPETLRDAKSVADSQSISETLLRLLREYVLTIPDPLPTTREDFAACVREGAARLGQAPREVTQLLQRYIDGYTRCRKLINSLSARHNGSFYHGIAEDLKQELAEYHTRMFIDSLPYKVLAHLPDNLDCLHRRIEVAFLRAGSYREKMRPVTRLRANLREICRDSSMMTDPLLVTLHRQIEQFTKQQFASQCKKKEQLVSADEIMARMLSVANYYEVRTTK